MRHASPSASNSSATSMARPWPRSSTAAGCKTKRSSRRDSRSSDVEIEHAAAAVTAAQSAIHMHDVIAAGVHRLVEVEVSQQIETTIQAARVEMATQGQRLLDVNLQLDRLAQAAPGGGARAADRAAHGVARTGQALRRCLNEPGSANGTPMPHTAWMDPKSAIEALIRKSAGFTRSMTHGVSMRSRRLTPAALTDDDLNDRPILSRRADGREIVALRAKFSTQRRRPSR